MMTRAERTPRVVLFVVSIALAFGAFSGSPVSTAIAQAERDNVAGVTNFGRVTDLYFRGGKVTSEGLRNLKAMGVRTVVDLAGGNGEASICKQLGITYYSFPMNVSARPDDAKIDEILSIIKDAKEPVYVHCAGGKHRAGTVCALYRMRVQGWTPEQAWAEEESYGFGSPSGHAKLYAYAYGARVQAAAANPSGGVPTSKDANPDKAKKHGDDKKGKKSDYESDDDHANH